MMGDDTTAMAPSGENGEEHIPLNTQSEPSGVNGISKDPSAPESDDAETDPEPRHEMTRTKRIFNTLAVYGAFVNLGLTFACIGPSLVDLEEVFSTDTKTIVVTFTCISVGYLVGTVISGYLSGKFTDSFFFFVCTAGMSVSLAVSALIRSLVSFCFFLTVMALFQGGVDCLGQVSILKLWQRSPYKDSLLQGIHFMWAVGSTISPFIIEPFLSEDKRVSITNSSVADGSTDVAVVALNASSEARELIGYPDLLADNATNATTGELETRVQFGILTVGVVSMVLSAFCFISFMLDGWRILEKKSVGHHEDCRKEQTRTFKIVMIVGIVAMYFCYIVSEQTTGNLLATFVIQGLHWEKYKGPLITSVFWGVFGVGRIVGIFLSKVCTPVQLLYLDSLVFCAGFTLLVALIRVHEAVTWACMGLIALGMGSFFAAGFSFIDQYMAVDGMVSACILGASSVSSMGMIPLTGYIFAVYGPMSMVYILFASSVVTLLIVIGLHLFARKFSSKEPVEMIEEKQVMSTVNA